MSLNACWSRPIAVLGGKERHALHIYFLKKISAREARLFAHAPASSTCASRSARMLSLLNPIVPSPLHSRFPFQGVILRHTLQVRREIPLTVPDNQRQLGECFLFVGRTCSFFQSLAQPFVRCTSAAFQPLLERTLSQSPHLFRWHLALSTDTFTFQKREDDRRALVDNRPALL